MSASDDWIGEVIIFDSNTSKIAKTMTLEKPGRYALRVR
jgi:RNA polymerase subunit RPABC4/transcription elongation factor Spt4